VLLTFFCQQFLGVLSAFFRQHFSEVC
jgi:hypothetical protein